MKSGRKWLTPPDHPSEDKHTTTKKMGKVIYWLKYLHDLDVQQDHFVS